MDDGEARGFLFGYDKLLGAKAPTAADIKNAQEGKETSLDRTRRLFYVTCSRARSSLALVAYSPDPTAGRAHVIANEWISADEVLSDGPEAGRLLPVGALEEGASRRGRVVVRYARLWYHTRWLIMV